MVYLYIKEEFGEVTSTPTTHSLGVINIPLHNKMIAYKGLSGPTNIYPTLKLFFILKMVVQQHLGSLLLLKYFDCALTMHTNLHR